jgi:deazaflavin-dependent oxidoreductase (nitroreductase family)
MDISEFIEQRVGVPLLMLHDKIYRGTNGRIGHHIPGGPPSLLLHTVGAKTGQQRTNSLSYARDGDDYLVVASKGGDPKAPGWYHNAKANPKVEINVGPKRFPVTARIIGADDPDYPRL